MNSEHYRVEPFVEKQVENRKISFQLNQKVLATNEKCDGCIGSVLAVK
jgi:hypothetical protein